MGHLSGYDRHMEPKATPDLSIHVHAPTADRTVFFPGDTIAGQIRRQNHIVRPEVWLIIHLQGRSVARVQKKTGTGQSEITHTYHTQYTLFPPRQVVCINGSPVHIPPDNPEGQAWNFQMQIPSHCCSPRLVGATMKSGWFAHNKQDPQMAFIPLDSQLPPALPCSLWSYQGRSSENQTTWVEYWLEAHLYDVSPYQGNVKHVAKARMPVTIYPEPLAGVQPIRMLRFWSPNQVVRSQRLLAGREADKLSFKEKMFKMVRSSRVPRLGLRVIVDLPGGIQLGELVGLRLGLWRLQEPTSGTGDDSEEDEIYPDEKKKGKMKKREEAESDNRPDHQQGESSAQQQQQEPAELGHDVKVRLTSLKIKIQGTTYVSVKGSVLNKYDLTKDSAIARLVLSAPALSLPGGDGNGIEIPFVSEESLADQRRSQQVDAPPPAYDSGKGKAKDSGKMIDLGALLGIRFNMKWFEICGNRYPVEHYSSGSWSMRKPGNLVPDFTTYNIRRTHSLVVKLGLEVAKEKVEVRFERGIEVLGATGYSS
ncbi:hypothetical protein QBC40DRAFT_291010 [Triangularia verruculosa]|uniref:Arrestin-like N-terminal domain-containing protein n=1 Tax=Triangularia verruculosa TaxID=2587418 RepID=A0AAN6X5F5_9PEZI|nr:hypothetical protein QBC40DRAFT_291010 [Triangularia verruculosa]